MARETDLKPVYLIVSDQKMLVDEAVARLKSRVGEAADLDFNMQVFEGENAGADDIAIACNTVPFGSDYRLVIVNNVEKVSKDVLDGLADYAADPCPTTVLAVAGEKLAKNTKFYKAVDRIGGVLVRKMEKRDFPGHVRTMFGKHGKSVSLEAAEELVAAVGYDLRRLSLEVDKAVAFVGDRSQIGRNDIEGVISTTAPTSVWEFPDALGDRDCRRALARLSSLLGDGESPFGLHALAVRSVRDLMAVRSLLDRGLTGPAQIAERLGRQEWQVKRLVRQARRFHAEELVQALRGAAEAEAHMKTSRDARLVLERWIIGVCG